VKIFRDKTKEKKDFTLIDRNMFIFANI